MKKIFLGALLFLTACATNPDGTPVNPVQQPFSWTTFCAFDVPVAQFLYVTYKTFGKVSARDQSNIETEFANIGAMCSLVPNNSADAQQRASMSLARVNDTLKNPNAAAPANVVRLPLKARPQE